MQILSVGNCPCCSKQIYDFKQLPFIQFNKGSLTFNFFKRVPYQLNKDGTYFWILCTDSTRMNVSICKGCLDKLTDEQVKNIYSDIIYTKLKAVEKDRRSEDIKYKLFERIRSVEIWRWAHTEQEIINYLGTRNATEKAECQKI